MRYSIVVLLCVSGLATGQNSHSVTSRKEVATHHRARMDSLITAWQTRYRPTKPSDAKPDHLTKTLRKQMHDEVLALKEEDLGSIQRVFVQPVANDKGEKGAGVRTLPSPNEAFGVHFTTLDEGGSSQSGQVLHIPFNASSSHIAFIIRNNSWSTMPALVVRAEEIPSWLTYERTTCGPTDLVPGIDMKCDFNFSVAKLAPVNEFQELRFSATSPNGRRWTHAVQFTVGAPKTFEMYQNYPNPFNPTTTISYQLSLDAHVRLSVFNMLGQEVAVLDEGDRRAGYYQPVFDGRNVASGAYVYRLVRKDSDKSVHSYQKKMLLVK